MPWETVFSQMDAFLLSIVSTFSTSINANVAIGLLLFRKPCAGIELKAQSTSLGRRNGTLYVETWDNFAGRKLRSTSPEQQLHQYRQKHRYCAQACRHQPHECPLPCRRPLGHR